MNKKTYDDSTESTGSLFLSIKDELFNAKEEKSMKEKGIVRLLDRTGGKKCDNHKKVNE